VAAIRLLFDHLLVAGVVPLNPAASVRVPQSLAQPQKRGAAVLQPDEARRLLDAIDLSDRSGLRDKALLGVMMETRARVSAIVDLDVQDYIARGHTHVLRLRGRGGQTVQAQVHDGVREALHAYMEAAGIGGDAAAPLWRTMSKERGFSARRMSRVDVFRMIRRRARAAGLEATANCDSLRVSPAADGSLVDGTRLTIAD
jgi:site-specific recombinase XerD